MATLTEVQMALKAGNKAEAAHLLKNVLQTRPSADAWVMAARLTSNPDTAKQHLQRALAFDPKHIKARDMLRDLGGKPAASGSALAIGFLPALQTELEKFGANRPILRDLPPKTRMITALSLFSGILVLLVVMLSFLLSPAAVPPAPQITPITIYQQDTLVNQWTAVGLNISNVTSVSQAPDVLSREQITLTVTDGSGAHQINVYLYDDVAAIVNDGARMSALTAEAAIHLGFIETAVIAYPAEMNQATVDLLFNALSPQSTTSL